jgi:hypothetical protein
MSGALAAHQPDAAAAQQQAPAAAQQPLKSDSAQDMTHDTNALLWQAEISKASSAGATGSSSGRGGSKKPAGAAAGLQRDDSASALDLIAALHLGDKPYPEGSRRKRLPSSGQMQSAIRE